MIKHLYITNLVFDHYYQKQKRQVQFYNIILKTIFLKGIIIFIYRVVKYLSSIQIRFYGIKY